MFPTELFIFNLFENGALIPWNRFRSKYNLHNNDFFKWRQLVSAIPSSWKTCISENPSVQVTSPPKQHALQLTNDIPIDKLTSKFLYTLLLHKLKKPPTSQVKLCNDLNDHNIDWKKVYYSGRKTTIDSYGRMFHYKCSQNILFLNKMLFRMNLVPNSLCSYCKSEDETIPHLFSECVIIVRLWDELRQHLHHITFPDLTPRSAYLGYFLSTDVLVNHIHLIFKIVIYNQREAGYCRLQCIIAKINSIKEIEKNITFLTPRAESYNTRKWARLNQV